MAWEKYSYWLKGGIWAAVIYIVLNVLTKGLATLFFSLEVLPFDIIPWDRFPGNTAFWLMFVLSLSVVFLLGAVLGWLMGKRGVKN